MTRGSKMTDIIVETAGWKTAWPDREADIRALARALRHAEAAEGRRLEGQFVVVLTNDARLTDLNRRFRGKNKPTNVLSFPDAEAPFGGIALALETVEGEARTQGKNFINHAKHMILHGFLHLIGYDHRRVAEARLMEATEIAILAGMRIPNPYLPSPRGRGRA
jgi:probable rRNA maturation factor